MSTERATVLRGARAPEALRIVITPGDSGVDMTDVSAVELEVRDASGLTSEWSVDIESATTDQLTLVHVFDSLGQETATALRIDFVARLTTPQGVYRAGPFHLVVADWS